MSEAAVLLRIVVVTYDRVRLFTELFNELVSVDCCEIVVVVDYKSRELNEVYRKISVERKNSNIEFIFNNERIGAPKCRNLGFYHDSPCEWVWFFDDDDLVQSEQIESAVNVLNRTNSSKVRMCVASANIFVDSIDNIVERREQNTEFLATQFGSRGNSVNTSCWIFASSLVRQVGGWDENLLAGQDTDILLRSAQLNSTALALNIEVFVRRHNGYKITSDWKRQLVAKKQFLTKNWKYLSWGRRFYYLATYLTLYPFFQSILKK